MERFGVTTSSVRVVQSDHLVSRRFERYGIGDTFYSVRARTGSGSGEEFYRGELYLPCKPHDSATVIAARAYDSRHMSSMPVVIERVSIAPYSVNPEDIIDIPVTVVIDRVAWGLPRIPPHVW